MVASRMDALASLSGRSPRPLDECPSDHRRIRKAPPHSPALASRGCSQPTIRSDLVSTFEASRGRCRDQPTLCCRRRAVLSAAIAVGLLAGRPPSARAAANVEVLRALERRKQSLEPSRKGVSSLQSLNDKLEALSDALREVEESIRSEDGAALKASTARLTERLLADEGLSRELTVMMRCVRPTFDRFEGLRWDGASEKLQSTLRTPGPDTALLEADTKRAISALDDIRQEVELTLQDPRQMWSFCFND